MKTTTNRMMIAIIAVIFATTFTSCKKENEVAPNGNSNNNTPAAVNEKPLSIITKDASNRIILEEKFTYANNNLVKYVAKSANRTDSIIVFQSANQNGYKNIISDRNFSIQPQTMFLSNDKQMHDFNTTNTAVTNNFVINTNSTIKNVVNSANNQQFLIKFAQYENGNISSFIVNGIGVDTVKVTYDESVGFKKGINELPVSFAPFKLFKVLELNNMTTTLMYSKLIKMVTLKNNKPTNNFTVHQYDYTLDSKGRISTIVDHKTIGTLHESVDFFDTITKTISYE
jgi:hypothetical protein